MHSSATATKCSAPTSSTAVATRRWEPPGVTSISRRSAVRKPGKIRLKVTPRPRSTSGGTHNVALALQRSNLLQLCRSAVVRPIRYLGSVVCFESDGRAAEIPRVFEQNSYPRTQEEAFAPEDS